MAIDNKDSKVLIIFFQNIEHFLNLSVNSNFKTLASKVFISKLLIYTFIFGFSVGGFDRIKLPRMVQVLYVVVVE